MPEVLADIKNAIKNTDKGLPIVRDEEAEYYVLSAMLAIQLRAAVNLYSVPVRDRIVGHLGSILDEPQPLLEEIARYDQLANEHSEDDPIGHMCSFLLYRLSGDLRKTSLHEVEAGILISQLNMAILQGKGVFRSFKETHKLVR